MFKKDRYYSSRKYFAAFPCRLVNWQVIRHVLTVDWRNFSWANLNEAIYRMAKKTGISPSKIDGNMLADWLWNRGRMKQS